MAAQQMRYHSFLPASERHVHCCRQVTASVLPPEIGCKRDATGSPISALCSSRSCVLPSSPSPTSLEQFVERAREALVAPCRYIYPCCPRHIVAGRSHFPGIATRSHTSWAVRISRSPEQKSGELRNHKLPAYRSDPRHPSCQRALGTAQIAAFLSGESPARDWATGRR